MLQKAWQKTVGLPPADRLNIASNYVTYYISGIPTVREHLTVLGVGSAWVCT